MNISINQIKNNNEWEIYHRIRKEQIFNPNNVVYNKNHPTITSTCHYHFVLYNDINIVTVAHIELLKNNNEAALRSLATDEPYKMQGYAKHMMQYIETWLRKQNRGILKMHANLHAEKFYRKLGYTDMHFNDPCIQKNYINLGKNL